MPGVTLNPKQENCPQDLTGDTKNIIRVVTITGHQKANLLGAPTGRSRWDGTAKVKKKQDRLGADARAPLRDNFRGQKNGGSAESCHLFWRKKLHPLVLAMQLLRSRWASSVADVFHQWFGRFFPPKLFFPRWSQVIDDLQWWNHRKRDLRSSSFYTGIDIHKDRYKTNAHTHTYVELHGKTHTVYLIYTYRCVYNIIYMYIW